MRLSPLAAATLAAVGLAAAPLLARDDAPPRTAPVAVGVTPDQLLAPYYEQLRTSVAMPEAGPNPALAPATPLTRIAFGSCNHQSAPQHMWAKIAVQNPQLFLMIGDNVYGDNGWDADAGLESLRASYALQASHTEFTGFRAKVPMMATWTTMISASMMLALTSLSGAGARRCSNLSGARRTRCVRALGFTRAPSPGRKASGCR